MNAQLRTAVVALIVVLLTVGVFGLRLAGALSATLRLIHRDEELQPLRQATYRRIEARQQAVQEYIAQRCTLAETMQRFQELDHEWPDYITPQQKYLPSDEERHYQVLLTDAEWILQGRPEELAAVLRRLEEDYQQLQADRQADAFDRRY